jgi:hypothetical protein
MGYFCSQPRRHLHHLSLPNLCVKSDRLLAPFKQNDQERIIRWAREKIGLSSEAKVHDSSPPGASSMPAVHPAAVPQQGMTIKHFVEQKSPKSENQFAAVVAYYHRFEASGAERKDTIVAGDLLEACRKANTKRIKNPQQTLINAHHGGLLDKTGHGVFVARFIRMYLMFIFYPFFLILV